MIENEFDGLKEAYDGLLRKIEEDREEFEKLVSRNKYLDAELHKALKANSQQDLEIEMLEATIKGLRAECAKAWAMAGGKADYNMIRAAAEARKREEGG